MTDPISLDQIIRMLNQQRAKLNAEIVSLSSDVTTVFDVIDMLIKTKQKEVIRKDKK